MWPVRTDTMITRTLLLALCCACASALAPVEGDEECALYLTGPGRSSAFDYSLNLLRGNFAYEGQRNCITYEAVNQAYLDARKRILVSQPKGDWKPEDYASVGELVLDISISLARSYGLTYEEIEKGLPLIDTSRTLIREVCPPVFSRVECRAGKYRRLDGLCNNLEHPTWGATNAPFQRLIGPLFADGINAPRISHTGRDLPLSRVVSRTMHPDEGFHDHAGTVMVIAWGQFMDHDYTLTGTPLDPINRNDPEECCKRPPHLKHPYCNEIRVPDDDYFYRLFGVKCIDFVRGFPSPRPGCRLGSRVPFNTLTGAIDGNTVYGVTEKFSRKLRTGYGGLLRMNPVFKEYGLRDLLPLKLDIPDEGCTRPNKNMYCFEAGEIRVNEQLVLTVMHTLMAREHNRVAKGLAEVNPHWDDETLFQEARRINIAEIQHITYNEFLPILLGKDVMEKFGLVLEKEGYWDGYDNTVNPDVIDSFASAAYRFGHSLLPTAVERWSKAHKFIASKRLSDLIRRPYDLYRAGVLDEYVMGLMNQVAQAMDDSITQEVTNHLFKKVGARFGMDLVSFNMQRGREFGIPGYMEFRKFCGLSGAETFQDLFGSMPNETVRKYESIFEHPIDVDLWSGGVSERPLPGSMLGPTFACVIATQFSYSRRGDRFWFELPNQPSSFTPEQLAEVRKARLARVICDNTDIIDTVQLYPMVLPDHELNPRVPCRSGVIPSMDFTKWAEPAPFHGAAKQFMTDAQTTLKEDISTGNNTLNTTIHDCSEIQEAPNENATLNNSNITENIDIKAKIECTQNISLLTHNCSDTVPTLNEKPDSDTVIKYVSGKNDEVTLKTSGHIRNSLRKKRSPHKHIDNIISNSAPEIVNYETVHSPSDRQIALPVLTRNSHIKNADLADFSIETLHEQTNNLGTNKKEVVKSHRRLPEDSPAAQENSSESRENDDSSEETTKSNIENNSNESNERDSNESREVSQDFKKPLPVESIESLESEDPKSAPRKSSSGETQKSEESNEDKSDKSKFIKPHGTDSDSAEDEDYSNERESLHHKEDDRRNNYSPTEDKSNETESPKGELRQLNLNDSGKGIPKSFRDVDLDDFSYERVEVNNKGEVEPAKDPHENEDISTAEEISTKDKVADENEHPRSEYIEKTNNGEIKPVVEINTESNNSNEFSEEDEERNQSQKADLNVEDKSLETLLGVKETDDSKHDKKAAQNLGQSNRNVKEEFERIPLNYKHDKKSKDDKDHIERPTENNEGGEQSNADGTLETLLPQDPHYDEKLNFKFDDVTIKLPEIKLPDDILSYDYENPYKKKGRKQQKHKDNFYHYSDEYSNENPLKHKPQYDDDRGYYSATQEDKLDYKQKQNSHEDEDEDENVDLYEKFVRERFGKRGSFGKRSEELRNEVFRPRPSDPKLDETIQQILKKSQQIDKEAEKSGDPKAGYMWTLEYGENL